MEKPPCADHSGGACPVVELSALPLAGVPPQEHALITNVVKAMLCTHYPPKSDGQYKVEEEQDHYNVSLPFPARTAFSMRQLGLVEQTNHFMVDDVWVQPEHDCVLLCASVRKSGSAANLHFEQCEMRIINRRVESRNNKRRRRTTVIDDDGGGGDGDDEDRNHARRRHELEAGDKDYPRWHPMRLASEFLYRVL